MPGDDALNRHRFNLLTNKFLIKDSQLTMETGLDIDEKLDEIRKESKGDFKFIMITFDNTTKAMNNMMNIVMKEMGTVQAKMARQKERFELMLDAVQRELRNRVDLAVVADHEARLQALERKDNPAA